MDGRGVLSVSVMRWDRAPEPTDWSKGGSQYNYAAQRKVAFAGYASIGSDHAVVQATCTTRTAMRAARSQTYTVWEGWPGAVCALSADGHKVLYGTTVPWDRVRIPWNARAAPPGVTRRAAGSTPV